MEGHVGQINSYNLDHELANLPPLLASPALPNGPKTPAPCHLYELSTMAPGPLPRGIYMNYTTLSSPCVRMAPGRAWLHVIHRQCYY